MDGETLDVCERVVDPDETRNDAAEGFRDLQSAYASSRRREAATGVDRCVATPAEGASNAGCVRHTRTTQRYIYRGCTR
ncbi:unnamed protein product, partial [Iphiclides podalirius]